MATFTKFSEWLGTELPNLPGDQTISTDQMVVIRGGVPYSYDPATRFAYSQMAGNATATTINTIDVWEPIAGNLVASGFEQGFTLAANVFTVTADTSLSPIQIVAGITLVKVGAGDDTYEVGIFVNGTLAGVGQSTEAHATKWGSVVVAVPDILANGDTVEIKLRNRTDIDNVIAQDMYFGIN